MTATTSIRWQLKIERDYLKAEVSGRETAAETRDFLRAVVVAAAAHDIRRVLISVRNSKPLFKVDNYGIGEFLGLVSAQDGRVALLADSEEIRVAQEYIEVLARQCGARVRSFRSATAAVEWLRGA